MFTFMKGMSAGLGLFFLDQPGLPVCRIAIQSGIRVIGFIGLIVAAAKLGLISRKEARGAVDDAVSRHGCRISIALYQRIAAELDSN